MEKTVVNILGTTPDGTEIKKILLVNPEKVNNLVAAQSYFTKDQKKEAKFKHKHRSV